MEALQRQAPAAHHGEQPPPGTQLLLQPAGLHPVVGIRRLALPYTDSVHHPVSIKPALPSPLPHNADGAPWFTGWPELHAQLQA